jgi:hypothetical protein
VEKLATHPYQLGEKRIGPFGFALTTFLGFIDPYKKHDDIYQKHLKDLVCYICKG